MNLNASISGTGNKSAAPIKRFIAVVLDLMIISVLMIIISPVIGPSPELQTGQIKPDRATIIIGVISYLYFMIFQILFDGTPGKLIVRIKIVRTDTDRPSILQHAVRTICYPLSGIFCIGFLMIIFTGDRRGLHDLIAGTRVINTRS
jgi:uncharacterized RDD family membrane protein YckC